MARLTTAPRAADHFAAIAQLRWRLFVNAFRRKGGKAEVIARIIVYPFVVAFAIGPVIASGAAGYFLTAQARPSALTFFLWLLFSIWIFLTLSSAAQSSALQSTTFDPSQLIRFPIAFPSYLVVRIFFGLLTFTTVVGFLCLFSASIGIGIARPHLFAWAALVLFIYGLTILFFLHMILLWMDRWLAQRRTRELFVAFFILFSVGIQFVSISLRSHTLGGHSQLSHKIWLAAHALAPFFRPIIAYLPPTLAAHSIQQMQAAQPLPAIATLLGLLIFTAVFLSLYARRLRGEFHGENFSEAAARPTTSLVSKTRLSWSLFGLPPTIAACLEKEIRYLLRGGPALIALITPLFFVFIFTSRAGYLTKTGTLMFPIALAYILFGLFAQLYNALGADANGVSLYLMAPIRFRHVFIAKNIVNVAIIAIEVLLATLIVTLQHPPTTPVVVATLLWVVFATLVNLSAGNLRSLYAPRKVQLNKSMRQPTSRTGSLITLGILFGSLFICMAVLWTCNYFSHPWLATPIFLTLAAAAFAAYILVLNRVDKVALDQRETLAEYLCKT